MLEQHFASVLHLTFSLDGNVQFYAKRNLYFFFLLLHTVCFLSLWDLKLSGQTSLPDWFLIVAGTCMSRIYLCVMNTLKYKT